MFYYGKSSKVVPMKTRGLTRLERVMGWFMPKQLHTKLEKEASIKGLKGDRKNVYIHAVLNKVDKK